MKILLLGYSKIAIKRLIPALLKIGEIESIDVACRRKNIDISFSKLVTLFLDYKEAIDQSEAEVCYISAINNEHFQWAQMALHAGKHVIIDKPACLNASEAQRLVALANEKRRMLSEATVFAFHPQVEQAVKIYDDAGVAIEKISACFSFPPLDVQNFRYQKKFGGGAIYDLGAYAIGAGVAFFNSFPKKHFASVNSRKGEVDVSFSLLSIYEDGKSLTGHFGFDTEYQNRVSLLGNGLQIEIDRVFTIPENMSNTLEIKSGNNTRQLKIEASDCFENYFRKVFEDIQCEKINEHSHLLLENAKSLDELIVAAGNS